MSTCDKVKLQCPKCGYKRNFKAVNVCTDLTQRIRMTCWRRSCKHSWILEDHVDVDTSSNFRTFIIGGLVVISCLTGYIIGQLAQ